MSRYAGTDKYTYPGSGVLINRAGIRDQAALDAFEADATSVRLLELHDDATPVVAKVQFASGLAERRAAKGKDDNAVATRSTVRLS